MGNSNNRDPEKEQFWRDMIAKQKRSGLTVRQFCEDHEIKPNTFYSWRKVIRKRNMEKAAEQSRRYRARQREPKESGAFVPLIIDQGKHTKAEEHKKVAELRIGEIVVSVFPGADLKTLQALMLVMRGF